AMVKLVGSGKTGPSAAEVASAAKVSLRTVFRHFEDIDSLYLEMVRLIGEDIYPLVGTPLEGETCCDKMLSLLKRRLNIYEKIMPFKIAANARRFKSEFLQAEYNAFLTIERSAVDSILPDDAKVDIILREAIQLVTSFDAWARLRMDQGLSVEDSEATLRRALDALLQECSQGK
ncbi:MAG: TetR/AcrR family transcriptional regulator, partial [Alphaproteobacteria bacterium]|nr:TetR/AcrR family transcriptional regulator [Alphaproteobacteria bacterium]